MKPILFNTEMVQAIMDGRKTVTRRLVKPQPNENAKMRYVYAGGRKGDIGKWHDWQQGATDAPKWNPPYHADDILYVRETWCEGKVSYGEEPDGRCVPFISQCPGEDDIIPKEWAIREVIGIEDVVWRPSIHMPKEAARIFLRVTHVRAERLQDITADECPMEGVWPLAACTVGERESYYKTAFAKLWDSTVKPSEKPSYGWDANPWVWVIEFEKISKEEAMKC